MSYSRYGTYDPDASKKAITKTGLVFDYANHLAQVQVFALVLVLHV
jgi:hypothetical protein